MFILKRSSKTEFAEHISIIRKATSFVIHERQVIIKMKSILFIAIAALACTVSSMAQNTTAQ
jgi:hypothetical protein